MGGLSGRLGDLGPAQGQVLLHPRACRRLILQTPLCSVQFRPQSRCTCPGLCHRSLALFRLGSLGAGGHLQLLDAHGGLGPIRGSLPKRRVYALLECHCTCLARLLYRP